MITDTDFGYPCIYLIEADRAFKVGTSTNPYKRLAEIRRAAKGQHGRTLVRFLAFGSYAEEAKIISALRPWCIAGKEWFSNGDEPWRLAITLMWELEGFWDFKQAEAAWLRGEGGMLSAALIAGVGA